MSMSESGRAIRDLLAALYPDEATRRDAAADVLRATALGGGLDAVQAMNRAIEAGRRATARIAELERDLADAQVALRAMVGQPLPDDRREVVDPPAGHRWATGHQMSAAPGRLICTTCHEPGAPQLVLAAECLERSR